MAGPFSDRSIDGVLLHQANPIPGATEALQYLQDHEIPFILLTNGGGKHEHERVADLSARLGVELSVDNFVQSHTPFRMLVSEPKSDGDDAFRIVLSGDFAFEPMTDYPHNKLAASGISPLGQVHHKLNAAGVPPLALPSHKPNKKGAPPAGGLRSRTSVLDDETLNSYTKRNLRGKTVLVTGSDAAKAREIAEAYGFGPVVIPADILKAHPDVYPFDPLMKEIYEATARPLPAPNVKIDAILVFNDPRDWALDTQIIIDLLLSRQGQLGTYTRRNGEPTQPNRGWQQDGQPRLYFSNPDLFWSARYHLPRLGQGAFQAALAGLWSQITQTRFRQHPDRSPIVPRSSFLRRTVIGKPTRTTYQYAEHVLNTYRTKLLAGVPRGDDGNVEGEGGGDKRLERARTWAKDHPLRNVYMVGDNPESDIRGANQYQSPHATAWNSVLVRTGVWNEKRDGAPMYKPKTVVDSVREAIDWALEREMGPK